MPSATARREAHWIAYHLREGVAGEDILPMWERRFPDLPVSRYQQAYKYAKQMLRVGARAQGLAQEAHLAEALGRLAAPDPRVSVGVIYHWTDATGRDYWNTVKVPATWDMTIAEIMAAAKQLLEPIMGRYPGSIQHGVEIIPSILWPSGEQL